jgi:hypothetical protein
MGANDKTQSWLTQYYGPDFDMLNPAVVQEGKKWALVRLTKNSRVPGTSNIGYVIVQKDGRHSITPHLSAHEGVANETDLKRMQKLLAEKEAES